jgi:subtilisin family serine protease
MKNLTWLAVIVLVAGIAGDALAAPPADRSGYEPDLLDVKFREDTRVRLRNGLPADQARDVAVGADLRGILRAFADGTWSRTHSVDEQVLDRLRDAGQANTPKPLPDLNNYLRLRLPRGLSAARAKEMLERYESVEAAYLVPKPAPPPTPPDYSAGPGLPYQDYLDAAPVGINARNAWSRGFSGAGIKVCDVEYAVNASHLDLPAITHLGNIAVDYFEDDHGTGVMGIVASKNDGSGTKGIAYNAQAYFAGALTNLGYNPARGVMECGAALSAGDIVLLEQQVEGPYGYPDYVPPEWSKPV